MKLTITLTSSGVPAIGKNPIINGWTHDGTPVITAQAMTEIAGGFYTYDFVGYNFTEDYVFSAFESTLPIGEQYVYMSNDSDSQNTQGVMKQILGMVQSNFKMTNQSYDPNGNLENAIIHTYEDAANTNADTNRLHTYSIAASYNAEGQLTDYKVTDV